MEKIGEGLQYHVFLVDEDTVKKFPKSRDEMLETIRQWESREEEVEDLVEKGVKRRRKTVRKLKDSDLPVENLFGITGFDGEKVLQKKMTPVEEFEEKSFEEIVDDYIDLLEELWRHGVGDTIYNFTINNGYRNGEIFQMDFGEIVFDRERVRRETREEKWLEKWSYSEDLDTRERKVFRSKMDERVYVERFQRIWNSK
ncbi:MAG: hypothetical protein ABEJ36_03330 [Candidatus Nanosalina sp.]